MVYRIDLIIRSRWWFDFGDETRLRNHLCIWPLSTQESQDKKLIMIPWLQWGSQLLTNMVCFCKFPKNQSQGYHKWYAFILFQHFIHNSGGIIIIPMQNRNPDIDSNLKGPITSVKTLASFFYARVSSSLGTGVFVILAHIAHIVKFPQCLWCIADHIRLIQITQ